MDREEARSARRSNITRIKNSTKPTFLEAEPIFYQCPNCRNLFFQEKKKSDHARLYCCSEILVPLEVNTDELLVKEHMPLMEVSGGFSSNTATITVGKDAHPMTENHHIEWIYLYTFRGGQFKYLQANQPPRAVFALAEEDSYVYCDREVCQVCKFNCKRGFAVFAYCNQHGLWRLKM